MLPQFKGEFYLYHLLEEYILKIERVLLGVRCSFCSHLVRFFTLLQLGSMKFAVTYISEECVVKTQADAETTLLVLKEEVQCRCENKRRPLKRVSKAQVEHMDNFFNPEDAR